MSSKYYLTIKDFLQKGRNFETEVETFSFGNPNPISFSWSDQTLAQTLRPLVITRKKDKHSNLFSNIAFRNNAEINGQRFIEKYSEASLTLDQYDKKRGLQSRTIYDFFDFEIVGYSEYMGKDQIAFDFAKASSFASSVQSITTP